MSELSEHYEYSLVVEYVHQLNKWKIFVSMGQLMADMGVHPSVSRAVVAAMILPTSSFVARGVCVLKTCMVPWKYAFFILSLL